MAASKPRASSVPGVAVIQRRIRVNAVWRLFNSKRVQIYHVDCESKYPVCFGTSGAPGEAHVYLDANDNTLKWNKSSKLPSEVRIPAPNDALVFVDCSRYSAHITIIRQEEADDAELVWEKS